MGNLIWILIILSSCTLKPKPIELVNRNLDTEITKACDSNNHVFWITNSDFVNDAYLSMVEINSNSPNPIKELINNTHLSKDNKLIKTSKNNLFILFRSDKSTLSQIDRTSGKIINQIPLDLGFDGWACDQDENEVIWCVGMGSNKLLRIENNKVQGYDLSTHLESTNELLDFSDILFYRGRLYILSANLTLNDQCFKVSNSTSFLLTVDPKVQKKSGQFQLKVLDKAELPISNGISILANEDELTIVGSGDQSPNFQYKGAYLNVNPNFVNDFSTPSQINGVILASKIFKKLPVFNIFYPTDKKTCVEWNGVEIHCESGYGITSMDIACDGILGLGINRNNQNFRFIVTPIENPKIKNEFNFKLNIESVVAD